MAPVGGSTAGASSRASSLSRSRSTTSPDEGSPRRTPMLPGHAVLSSTTSWVQFFATGALLFGFSGIGAQPRSRYAFVASRISAGCCQLNTGPVVGSVAARSRGGLRTFVFHDLYSGCPGSGRLPNHGTVRQYLAAAPLYVL